MSEMSQEDIDKLLNGTMNNQDKEKESGSISQEEIDNMLQENKPQIGNHEISQAEIDAMINESMDKGISQIDILKEEKQKNEKLKLITQEEKDVIGEVGNISFGSASTTLSKILNKTVHINTPTVEVMRKNEAEEWKRPHVVLNVNYTKGLDIENILVIQKDVALTIADLMMGGSGAIEESKQLTDLELSAVQESMNQMMGSSATSMSEMFNLMVDISPPTIKFVEDGDVYELGNMDEYVVRISFDLRVENLIQSKLVQIVSIENAKKMAHLLISASTPKLPPQEVVSSGGNLLQELVESQPEKTVSKISKESINPEKVRPLVKDVVVKIDVIFGHTVKTLKEILEMEPGKVVDLMDDVDEYLEMYANGVLIAHGKIVNVEGSFGIEIKELVN